MSWHRPPPVVQAAGVVVVLILALSVFFIAFALPAVKSKPHQVPVGVVASPTIATELATSLERSAPGGFTVTSYPDQTALRGAIRSRDVYGGFVFGGDGPTLLIATGGSPAVAQSLMAIGATMSQKAGAPPRVEDLAPLPPGDPRGVGLVAAALPLTLAGLLPAVVLILLFPGAVWLRLGATVAFAAVAAVVIAALLRYVFGSIDSAFWAVTAGLFVGILATALAMLGLGSLFGRIGLAIGAGVAILLGNPLSAMGGAPELLPGGWGAFGQLLPQGATATLLRSTAYFPAVDSSTALGAIIVLACWAMAGLLATVVAGIRQPDVRA